MHDSLRDPLPVEVGNLVDVDEVLKLFIVRLSIFLLNVGKKVRTCMSRGPRGPTVRELSLSSMGHPSLVVRTSRWFC